MLYIQHILKLFIWPCYCTKDYKTDWGGHRGLQDYRHVITSTFLTFFTFFSKSKRFLAVFRTFSRIMVTSMIDCLLAVFIVRVCYCVAFFVSKPFSLSLSLSLSLLRTNDTILSNSSSWLETSRFMLTSSTAAC